jgi:hypothetical protein
MIPPGNQVNRLVGIDAQERCLVVGGLDRQGQISLPLPRIDLLRFRGWARKHLLATRSWGDGRHKARALAMGVR